MRQSVGGLATTASTAAAKFRLPALTQTARRPPNSGTVCASSTSRDGSDGERVALDANERERIVRVVHRGVDDFFGALVHEAGVRPAHQHDRPLRTGARHERIDFVGFESNHDLILCRVIARSRRRPERHFQHVSDLRKPSA